MENKVLPEPSYWTYIWTETCSRLTKDSIADVYNIEYNTSKRIKCHIKD